MSERKKKRIGAVIAGGSGYGAGELLRFLCRHPEVEVVAVTSSSNVGTPVASSHSHLRGFCGLSFVKQVDFGGLDAFEQSVIFAALPHGTSSKIIAELMPQAEQQQTKIIDLSGDLRLKEETTRRAYYEEVNAPQALVDKFVYGLTELRREEIRRAQFVTNPGCLASGCILAGAPLVSRFAVECLHFDAKTGTSGAGRSAKAEFHHPEIHGNTWAYKVLEHRHEPEISQALADCSGRKVDISFVPHVIPAARGIYVTAHALLKEDVSPDKLREAYGDFYRDSLFVRVSKRTPQLHDVVLSNFCDIAVFSRGRQVIAISALDNLVKGMAGQAIQNMNLMCGLAEQTGLNEPASGPV